MGSRIGNLIRVVCLFVGIIGAAGTAAAKDLPSFDCVELLRNNTLGNIGYRNTMRMSKPTLKPLIDAQIPVGRDPVSVVELLNNEAPFLAKSEAVSIRATDSEHLLMCNLIIVEFRTNQHDQLQYVWAPSGQVDGSARIPILLVDTFESIEIEQKQFELWRQNDFQIRVLFRPLPANSKSVQIDADVFQEVSYFGKQNWTKDNVLFAPFLLLPETLNSFMIDSRAIESLSMIVLCGSDSCEDFWKLLPGTSGRDQPLPNEDIASDLDALLRSDIAPNDASRLGFVRSDNADNVGPFGTTMSVTLSYIGTDGKEVSEPLKLVGGMECIMMALGAKIFLDPPECSGDAYVGLADRNSLIRIVENDRWQIVSGARYPDPKRIVVTLPEGQSPNQCLLNLEYEDENNILQTLQLEPIPDTVPAQFAVDLDNPLRRYQTYVKFRIHVESLEVDCGGRSREVYTEMQAVLALPLVTFEREVQAVAYLPILNASDLEVVLGFNRTGRRAFGSAVVNALEAAHVRLSALKQDHVWSLASTDILEWRPEGKIETLLSLSSVALRSRVSDVFGTISESKRETIADKSVTISRNRLEIALRSFIEATRQKGIDRLTVILIGLLTDRDANGLNDPCRDPRYLSLPKDLSEVGGPIVEVVIFPITQLRTEDRPDLWNLVPLSFKSNPPSLPGGMYACRETQQGVAVYPFYVEPWRGPSDITPRYATALTDQLAVLLEDLLEEREVK